MKHIVVSCVALLLNMTGFMSVAAVLPALFDTLSLRETQAGWLAGATFASYAVTVPILTAITDKSDARTVVVGAMILTGLSGIGFALYVEEYWSALVFRLLAGIGFAGVHFPGLKMLADRLPPNLMVRGSGVYISMFSLGGAGSFFLAGVVIAFQPWPWVFAISGFCSLLGALLIMFQIPARKPAANHATGLASFHEVMSNAQAMRYVVAYFGHVWEMFSFRQWYVVFLGVSAGLSHNREYGDWNLPFLAGLTSLAAWPASLIMLEVSQRYPRGRVITFTALTSLAVALALAMLGSVSTGVLVGLMIFYSMTCFGDSSAMASGLMSHIDARVRGTALALYALLGFCGGALGPAVVGMVMEAAGGRHDADAWILAWLTIGAGTLIVVAAINFPWRERRKSEDDGSNQS